MAETDKATLEGQPPVTPQNPATPVQNVQNEHFEHKPQPQPPVEPDHEDEADPKIKKLRAENAQRRVEAKELREKVAALEAQAAESATLKQKLSSLEENFKAAQDKAQAAESKAQRAQIYAKYGLPEDVQKALDATPVENLESSAKVLAERLTKKPFGWEVGVGADQADKPDMAKRIFDRINNKGNSAFDPDVHKAKGGGFYSD